MLKKINNKNVLLSMLDSINIKTIVSDKEIERNNKIMNLQKALLDMNSKEYKLLLENFINNSNSNYNFVEENGKVVNIIPKEKSNQNNINKEGGGVQSFLQNFFIKLINKETIKKIFYVIFSVGYFSVYVLCRIIAFNYAKLNEIPEILIVLPLIILIYSLFWFLSKYIFGYDIIEYIEKNININTTGGSKEVNYYTIPNLQKEIEKDLFNISINYPDNFIPNTKKMYYDNKELFLFKKCNIIDTLVSTNLYRKNISKNKKYKIIQKAKDLI